VASCGVFVLPVCEAVIVGSGRHSGPPRGFLDRRVFGICHLGSPQPGSLYFGSLARLRR